MNTVAIVCLGLTALLHALFVFGEMVPLKNGLPLILASALKKRGLELANTDERKLVVTIVQNAGVYNLIMTAGFVFAIVAEFLAANADASTSAFSPASTDSIQCFFCGGAIVAGLYGMGLSKGTLLQAGMGLISLGAVLFL